MTAAPRWIRMRNDVEFRADGTLLRGWFYRPRGAAPFATVIMAHGFSALKEHFLDCFAQAFADAGLAVLVYDNRNCGASDGEPRGEIDPWRQVRDYREAITFAATLPDVDSKRIGIWGSSYSGGHVLVVAALDRRVRCVVSQVPLVSGELTFRRLLPGPQLPALLQAFESDRMNRYRGDAAVMLPVVSGAAGTPCVLPGQECFEFFRTTSAQAPAWVNSVTLRSAEMAFEYEPAAYIERIAPTPLMLVVADHDTLTPTDCALVAYKRALEPKRLALIPGGHFDPYVRHFDLASGAACDWFCQHLQ